MEAKTIVIIVLVLAAIGGGYYLFSNYGVSSSGQFYQKSTFEQPGTCPYPELYKLDKCLPKTTGEPTYLDTDGCCRPCTDKATGPEMCNACVGLSDNCVWQTSEPIVACFDATDPLFFESCADLCRMYPDAKGASCYSDTCSVADQIC